MEKQATSLHPFHVLAKPVGPLGNLACKYSFYLEKERLYPGNPQPTGWTLPDEILEEYIRQYIASQPTPVVSFAWQGGEPTLLGVDYFHKILARWPSAHLAGFQCTGAGNGMVRRAAAIRYVSLRDLR